MPTPFSVDEFEGKVDSLYRLVSWPPGAPTRSRKTNPRFRHGDQSGNRPSALEEVLDDKLRYYTGTPEEENTWVAHGWRVRKPVHRPGHNGIHRGL